LKDYDCLFVPICLVLELNSISLFCIIERIECHQIQPFPNFLDDLWGSFLCVYYQTPAGLVHGHSSSAGTLYNLFGVAAAPNLKHCSTHISGICLNCVGELYLNVWFSLALVLLISHCYNQLTIRLALHLHSRMQHPKMVERGPIKLNGLDKALSRAWKENFG